MPNNPKPITMRMLESPTGDMVYIVVEQMLDDDIDGEVVRLRAHSHPPGTPRTATFSNAVVVDETGNQYDLRRRYINLLLDYYDKKWKRVGASQFGSTERENFWLLDQL
jgi:hypothetical protein